MFFVKNNHHLLCRSPRKWRVQTVTKDLAQGIRDFGFDIPVKTLTAENCLQIGYVGRFVEEKGLPILLQAAKKN